MKNRPLPVISAEAQILADYLRTIPIGDIVPYPTLTNLVNADIQLYGRGWLSTARKIVLREDRLVFEAIRGIGIKRLTDMEIAQIGRTALRRINHTAKRGVDKSRCIDNVTQLPVSEQLKLYTHLSLLNLFHNVSTGRSVKMIENVLATAPRELEKTGVLTALLGTPPSPPPRPIPENV